MTDRASTRFDDVILTGGTGRSGTTIAGLLISRHSQIVLSRPTEIRLLTDGNGLLDLHLGRKVGRYKRLLFNDWAHLQRFRQRLYGQWWTRDAKLSPNKPNQMPGRQVGLLQSISKDQLDDLYFSMRREFKFDKSNACREFLRGIVEIHKAESKKSMWVDTTPINIARARELHGFLDGVRFIHMVRDGRDAISSVIKEPWGPNSFDEGLNWWRGRMIRSLNSAKAVGPAMLTLALEDLAIDKRESSYLKLVEFLGLRDEEKVRDYFENNVLAKKVRRGRWRGEVPNEIEFNKKYFDIVSELKEIDSGVPLYL